MKYQEI